MRPHRLAPALLALALASAGVPAAHADRIVYSSNQCDQAGDPGTGPSPFGAPACDSELWTVEPDGSNNSQLTFNAVTDSQPAWSPDGLRIAVARAVPDDHSFTRVHVIGADGAGGVQVSHGPGDGAIRASDTAPAWSPLGDLIAFSSGFHADVFTIPATGGAAVPLTHTPEHEGQPSFSPDGTRLAFIRFALSDDNAVGLGTASIWTSSAAGGPALRVTSGDIPVAFSNFSFSPDCRRVAFSTDDRVHTVGVFGGPIEPVGPPGSSDPDWSPDGRSIVYSLRTQNPTTDLYALDVSRPGATPVRLTHPVQGFAGSPDWAPDGLLLPGCRGADVLPPLLQLIGGKLDQVVALTPLGRRAGSAAAAVRPRRLRARDLHYLAVDRSGIRSLEAAFGRHAERGGCRWLAGRRLAARRSCARPRFAPVRDERAWRMLTRRLRRGTWTVAMRGRDAEGNRTRRPLAATVRVTGR